MGKQYREISVRLKEWIACQKMFFVATAPLSGGGHINCSPKGLDSFRVISPQEVAYQDLTGSGIETIAHLKENGRIVIMFCAFDGPPKIVRLHGVGQVIESADPEFEVLAALFPERAGTRAFIRVRLEHVSDSCGYAVPVYDFVRQRDVLDKWTANKGSEGLKLYRAQKNLASIDGLKGLEDL